MNSMLYCGWDGGGTKTEVALVDEHGTPAASADFGPLNINGADSAQVRETVESALAFMSKQWGGLPNIGALVVGMAGVSNRQAAPRLAQALKEAGWSGPLSIVGDQEIALSGAIQGHGAVLIAGTGSICFGRDPLGQFFRVGGYGYRIDDEGGGYAIGRDILTAVVRAADGRLRPTQLTELVFSALHVEDIGGLITWLYAPDTGKKDLAALSRLLEPALERHDAAALRIADRASDELAGLVTTGWRKTGMRDGELALTGSILQHNDWIRHQTTEKISSVFPAIRVRNPLASPAVGAARMAMKLAGSSPASCP